MKQRVIAFFLIAALCCTALLSGCRAQPGETRETAQPQRENLYQIENDYHPKKFFFQKHFWINYGTVLKDVAYYSRTAGEAKHCNILLPAHYSKHKEYPVLYVLHGFYGDPEDHIDNNSYLTVIYGNLLYRKMAKEMIIVSVDMYTDKAALKKTRTQKQLHFIFDKVVQDIYLDVMPLIESRYSIKKGKANTAIAGISEGGTKALCSAFTWMEQFGYVGAFAPDPGVVPTKYYKGTFWEKAYFQSFPRSNNEQPFYYLYLAIGSKDEANLGITLAYREALNAEGIANQTDYVKGCKHNMKFWKLCFYNFLQKVFR